MKRLAFLFILPLALLVSSCGSNSVPPGVMSEQQMVDFLSDAYLIEGFYAIETGYHYELLSDQIVDSYRQLLQKHNISQRKFERSMDYYIHHSERYKRIHQQVVDRLDASTQQNTLDTPTSEPLQLL